VRRRAAIPDTAVMTDHVYKSVEITGSSPTGVKEAIDRAIAKASETLRHIDWFELLDIRGHVDDGKVAHYQVTLKIGFRLED
jgi:flavin-binding protein dodecin